MEDKINIIQRAQRGDQDALSELYNLNYFAVLGAIRSLIRDEDDAIDLLQDTFIKAFGHLDQLKGDFGPWVKRIGVNTAKDFLKKKKPILFSQLQGEEDRNDSPIEESFAQETFEGRPDIIMDEQETARLLGEILDSIPEEQRIVINLCYYQEMSYKEIAAMLGIPENLVRSRLNLGREKVEKQVLALEKRGTKLYGLAPIPFLLFLFRNLDAKAAEMQPDLSVLQKILSKSIPTIIDHGNIYNAQKILISDTSDNADASNIVSIITQKRIASSVVAKVILVGVLAVIGFSGIIMLGSTKGEETDEVTETTSITESNSYGEETARHENELTTDINNPINKEHLALYQYEVMLKNAYQGYIDPEESNYLQIAGVFLWLDDTYFGITDLTGSGNLEPQLIMKANVNDDSVCFMFCLEGYEVVCYQEIKGYNPETKQYLMSQNKVYEVLDGRFNLSYQLHGVSQKYPYYHIEYPDGTIEEISKENYNELYESFIYDAIPVDWTPFPEGDFENIFDETLLTAEEQQIIKDLPSLDYIQDGI